MRKKLSVNKQIYSTNKLIVKKPNNFLVHQKFDNSVTEK